MTDPVLARGDGCWIARFAAMASPCELLIDGNDEHLAHRLATRAWHEAARIEQKFSRYRNDSVIQNINRSEGTPIEVDAETAALLDYADTCWRLSEGRFDITSGVLRRAWRFDGSDRLPAPDAVTALLAHVGWQKVRWERPLLTLPPGMEIDFGGIGKEYAVDRTARLLATETDTSLLVNFGGDLVTTGPRQSGGWRIGVENPERVGDGPAPDARLVLELTHGGIATSGDSRRFLLKDGKRYGHILDPHTGWPVEGAPRSVTVLAATCTDAGMLATLAMLQGAGAERFLDNQGVRYWCLR